MKEQYEAVRGGGIRSGPRVGFRLVCGDSYRGYRGYRGGSWNYSAQDASVANRGICAPGNGYADHGFRLVREGAWHDTE